MKDREPQHVGHVPTVWEPPSKKHTWARDVAAGVVLLGTLVIIVVMVWRLLKGL